MASALFNFDLQKTYAQSVEVEDLGNCALRCSNQDFVEFYLTTQTVMGKTYVLKFGPILPDLAIPADDFALTYKKFDYKESLIEKEINQFINDGRRKINLIEIIPIEDALEAIPAAEAFIPE